MRTVFTLPLFVVGTLLLTPMACGRRNVTTGVVMPSGSTAVSQTATGANAPGSPDRVNAAITQAVTFSDWGISGGFTALPLDKLLALHPQLTRYQQEFVHASAQTSPLVPPQLLVAICLQESSGGLDTGNGGPFQFWDTSSGGAFATYGPKGGDRYNMGDAAIGGANYMAALLKENNADLNAALRVYNGAISQGGKPSYQSDIQRWMQGEKVYGDGV